ncbi:MAG: MFS transporter [Phycisphaerae bacterium]
MTSNISNTENENLVSQNADHPDRYRVGTLQYTKMGLVMAFVWLLWGDFSFTLMEKIIPSVLPLKLQSLNASNWLMTCLVSTIPGVMTVTFNPYISFSSDRYRSRWGRRIPFLVFGTPFIVLVLVLLGYSDQIGRLLHTLLIHWFPSLTPETTIIIIIAILMAAYEFFNIFVNSIYIYLFNDVIPVAFLNRFMALFRVVSMGALSLYSWFVYKYAQTHMKEIFVGAAILYFVGFTIMCLKVKEGQYPPPSENIGRKKGIWAMGQTYFLECFTHRYYWYFFLSNAFWNIANSIGMFYVFRDLDLGLTLDQMGKITAAASIITAILCYPAGMLADRLHPLRVMIGVKIIILIMAPIGLLYLFFDFTPQTVLYITIVTTCILIPVVALYKTATLPMYMAILPKDRYGQFSSANSIVINIFSIFGVLAAGLFMDFLKNLYHGDKFYYRYAACWTLALELISMVFLLLLYRGWKQHGGRQNYVPPDTARG